MIAWHEKPQINPLSWSNDALAIERFFLKNYFLQFFDIPLCNITYIVFLCYIISYILFLERINGY